MAVRLVQNDLPPAARSFVELVDGVPQVLGCLKRRDGTYAWSNEGFALRVGRDVDGVVGRTVADLFPADFARSYAAQDERVLATGRPLQRHLELIVRTDRDIGWYVTSKSCVREMSGDPWGIAVLSFDL
ncbi:MAG: PAS domain-containing protein, partial [bacterium]|nr:PAS domain-containing protein [bacterium]